MEIKINIDDDKVQTFTDGAKNRLSIQAESYVCEIISESEKVEEFFREDSAISEITETIIVQAARRNRTSIKHKKKWWLVVVKILSELLLFISGLLFNQDKFATNILYFVVFSLIFVLAVILTVIMHVRDGE